MLGARTVGSIKLSLILARSSLGRRLTHLEIKISKSVWHSDEYHIPNFMISWRFLLLGLMGPATLLLFLYVTRAAGRKYVRYGRKQPNAI